MKAYHIVHHNDEDGLASAAVIYEYLKIANKANRKTIRYFFYEIDYTMELKDILPDIIPKEDEFYFLDYSFSNPNNLKCLMDLLIGEFKITWIDHHKSSLDLIDKEFENKTPKNLTKCIDTNYCGAYLCYIYAYFKLNNTYSPEKINNIDSYPKHIPSYIKYVDSWDTWKHNMPNTTEFNLGLKTIKRTPRNAIGMIFKYDANASSKIFSDKIADINMTEEYMKQFNLAAISKGKTISEYEYITNESICEDNGFAFTITDYTDDCKKIYNCFAVNKRGNSTIFGDRFSEYDIVIPFQFNGTKFIYSLYTSKDGIDCAELAKKLGTVDGLGGGGHVKAAGFQAYSLMIASKCNLAISNKLFRRDKYNIITYYNNDEE